MHGGVMRVFPAVCIYATLLFANIGPALSANQENTPLRLLNKKIGSDFVSVAVPSIPPSESLRGFLDPQATAALATDSAKGISEAVNKDDYFVLIGDGFNSLQGVPAGACVAFDPLHPKKYLATVNGQEPGNAQDVDYYLHSIDSVEQLLREISFSASAEFGSGISHGEASVEYFNQYRYSKYNSFLVVRVRVVNEAEGLINPQPTDLATQALGQPQDFFDRCGDKFVRGRITGGDFAAIIRYEAENESQLSTLHAEISVAVGNFQGSAQLSQRIESIKSFKSREVKVIRRGTADPIPEDIAALEKYAEKFPGRIAKLKNAPVIALLLASYRNLLKIPEAIEQQVSAFEELANIDSAARRIRSGVDEIRHHQQLYPPLPDDILVKSQRLDKLIDDIRDRVHLCAATLSVTCRQPYKPTLPIDKLPEPISWTRLDPTTPADQLVGASSLGEYAILSQGCWLPHKYNASRVVCVPGTDGGGVGYKLAPLKPGDISTIPDFIALRGVTSIPPNSRIIVKLFDSYYEDNASLGSNPLEVGLFETTSAIPPDTQRYLNTITPMPRSLDEISESNNIQ